MSYENFANLANACRCAVWLNIPLSMSDELAHSTIADFRDLLNGSLKLYVERS